MDLDLHMDLGHETMITNMNYPHPQPAGLTLVYHITGPLASQIEVKIIV